MIRGIRCPRCDKKLAEDLVDGTLYIYCRVCKRVMRIDSKVQPVVLSNRPQQMPTQ